MTVYHAVHQGEPVTGAAYGMQARPWGEARAVIHVRITVGIHAVEFDCVGLDPAQAIADALDSASASIRDAIRASLDSRERSA